MSPPLHHWCAHNQCVTWADGRRIQIAALAQDPTKRQSRLWPEVALGGVAGRLSLQHLPDKDLLAVVSWGLQPRADLRATYRPRWAIELGGACLNTKGFDLESTHWPHPDRLEKMFAIARMAAAVARAASKDDNQIQTGSRKHPTRKKSTATPHAPLSSAA